MNLLSAGLPRKLLKGKFRLFQLDDAAHVASYSVGGRCGYHAFVLDVKEYEIGDAGRIFVFIALSHSSNGHARIGQTAVAIQPLVAGRSYPSASHFAFGLLHELAKRHPATTSPSHEV